MTASAVAVSRRPSMSRRTGKTVLYVVLIALALVLLPGLARAQEKQDGSAEQLLSANTQLYIRWDGVKAHRAAYEKTALGKMMKGDTGKFFDTAISLLNDTMASALTEQGLLRGTKPDDLQKLQADAAEATKLLGLLADHGFIFAAEAESILPPSAQVTPVTKRLDTIVRRIAPVSGSI